MLKMPSLKTKKLKCNALDYCIIIALVLCLVGAGVRIVLGQNGGNLSSQVAMEEYVLSFKIVNIRNTSSEYLTKGELFYLKSTQQYFGEIADAVSVTPALFYVENVDGQYVPAYAPENGDATRIDVSGTMRVSGYMGSHGFLLGGTTSLAPNKSVQLISKNLSVTIEITDIEKAS